MIRQSERKQMVYCNLSHAYLSVLCSRDAAVVFHTPRACSHLALRNYWSVRRRAFLDGRKDLLQEENRLFVTGITDKEAIFGGEKILRECLLDAAKMPGIAYIVVAAGCTAGVIGDDTEAVCAEVEAATGVPVIAVSGSGFMGRHYVDYAIELLEKLLARFAVFDPEKRKDARAKLAVVVGENRATGNEREFAEIARLLRYFGFTRVLFPPNGMTREEFSLICGADLILPVGVARDHFPKMQAYGEVLAERYGAKCAAGNYPRGAAELKGWLGELGVLLGMEQDAEKAWRLEEKHIATVLERYKPVLQGKKALFVVGYASRYYDPSFHWEALRLAGAEFIGVVLHDDLTGAEKAGQRQNFARLTDIAFYETSEIGALAQAADLILTTTELPDTARQLLLSIHQVGTAGLENFVKKAAEAAGGRGRRILYEA